jgi:hypothetical protein
VTVRFPMVAMIARLLGLIIYRHSLLLDWKRES